MALLQRKFGVTPSRTHSPYLLAFKGTRMQSLIKAALQLMWIEEAHYWAYGHVMDALVSES